jgi:hypothetical protein
MTMTEYYYPVDIIDKTNPLGGSWVAAWQHIKDDAQVGLVDASGNAITPPAACEIRITNATPHFSPGVVQDPSAKPTVTLSLADVLANIKAGTSHAYLAAAADAATPST